MSDGDEMDARLTRALERAPSVAIPEDFALRVAARVPARAMVARGEIAASHVGRRVAMAVAVVLLVAMFALAGVVHGRGVVGWLEIGLAIEFAGLTAWLGLRRLMGL